MTLVTHDGGAWVLRGLKEELKDVDLFGRIEIGNNVHVGTNAMTMPGVKIGNNCIIGSCAVVTKNIPDNSVAVGVPVHVIETVDEYLKKHNTEFVFTKRMSYIQKKNYLLNESKIEGF